MLAALSTLTLRKNAARARYWVWTAALLKFVAPFSLLIALGSHIPWRTVSAPGRAYFPTVLDQAGQPFHPPVATSNVAPPLQMVISLTEIVFGIWVCGFIGITTSWWVRWRRIAAMVRAGDPMQLHLRIRAISSPALLEPGIFGVIRPVLLLPQGIEARLSPAELDAVIAHELCHVRHRDNLIAAIQMFVEAVCWFHPLVWWLGARKLEERERACDEEVLQLGCESRVYAHGILRACEFYLESPVACVAGVSGANLRKRIERILENRNTARLSATKRAAFAAAAFGLGRGAAPVGCAQRAAPARSIPFACLPRPGAAFFRSGVGEAD